VLVRDLIHHTSITLTAGQRYTAAQPAVGARSLLPPPGRVFTGVTGESASSFQRQVGKHSAIFGYFTTWSEPIRTPLAAARAAHARLFLHISTDIGYGSNAGEELTPRAIARGDGDRYLLDLARELLRSARPAYIALLPEMNQANNAYCAFNRNGSSRGSDGPSSRRSPWRRCSCSRTWSSGTRW